MPPRRFRARARNTGTTEPHSRSHRPQPAFPQRIPTVPAPTLEPAAPPSARGTRATSRTDPPAPDQPHQPSRTSPDQPHRPTSRNQPHQPGTSRTDPGQPHQPSRTSLRPAGISPAPAPTSGTGAPASPSRNQPHQLGPAAPPQTNRKPGPVAPAPGPADPTPEQPHEPSNPPHRPGRTDPGQPGPPTGTAMPATAHRPAPASHGIGAGPVAEAPPQAAASSPARNIDSRPAGERAVGCPGRAAHGPPPRPAARPSHQRHRPEAADARVSRIPAASASPPTSQPPALYLQLPAASRRTGRLRSTRHGPDRGAGRSARADTCMPQHTTPERLEAPPVGVHNIDRASTTLDPAVDARGAPNTAAAQPTPSRPLLRGR